MKGKISVQYVSIGAAARESGVPPKTIRYYESIGLVQAAVRRPNGYRSYSALDMQTLAFIKRARNLGFSVEEVRDLLDLWRDKRRKSVAVKTLAAEHMQAIDRKIEELRTMRKALEDLTKRCRGDSRPECPILEHLEEERRRAAAPAQSGRHDMKVRARSAPAGA